QMKKLYANEQDKGTLVCDRCGKTRVINLADFKNIGKPLKVKCGCGYIFFVSIEVRKFYRKDTNLTGEYIRISHDITKGLEKGAMTVEDLSRTGIGFRTKAPHNIHVRDMLRVRFILDDARQSEVSKSAVVRRVELFFVGAEFLDFDAFNETNRTLGFYLMPR
ncbi:MAG: PilZ domain-containing protein, partial [Candidatus Tectomicrobia bacterium]|nr:PilZ domain-containing protein [Candidatus Tectomicrobia bacterium]